MSAASDAAPASVFAEELLGSLIAGGVRDVVVCPGSRSQALALAAARAEQDDAIRLHVRIDERSAAFFAMGVARETGIPAPVIVTSGTAVAGLVPAALEAHESRVPMVLLTADRPAELQGIRSNQTTRQASLLAGIARLSLDVPAPSPGPEGAGRGDTAEGLHAEPGMRGAAELARTALATATGRTGGAPGPVHLNLAFREPLSGPLESSGRRREAEGRVAVCSERELSAGEADPAVHYVHVGDKLAVVIAGEGAGSEAEAFAHAAGLPLLAEAVSGARFGREAITAYATLIDDPTVGGLTEQAIVFGHPTLTRQVPALLRRPDVDVVVVDPYAGSGIDVYDPSRDARVVRSARVADDHDPRLLRRWLGAWVVPDRELARQRSTIHEPDFEAATASGYRERNAYARAEVASMREPVTRTMLVEGAWRGTWPHDRLVVAASRLVRVLDGIAPARRLAVHANRGVAGIDGTVATAFGIASASQAHDDPAQAAGTTRVLIGDLALLHDVGSLLLPEAERHPRIQLLVGNDGGGTIFDGLEVAESTGREAFDRVMHTPQRVGFAQLAAAYGWEYRIIRTRVELDRLFTVPVTGPTLVEVPLAR